MNPHFQNIHDFYKRHEKTIMSGPSNEWAIPAYAWDPLVNMTPIEEWLWADIREANAVFYPQWPIAGFFLDFANPVAKVAIECDGAAFHKDKEKDAARDSKLGEMGWVVYRLTGRECRTDYDEETGESGFARQTIDHICTTHNVKRLVNRGGWMTFQQAGSLAGEKQGIAA